MAETGPCAAKDRLPCRLANFIGVLNTVTEISHKKYFIFSNNIVINLLFPETGNSVENSEGL